MRQAQKILCNTLLLTGASLLMQAVGVIFQVYLSGRIGAEGIGLYQLAMSVYSLAVTVAISGVRFAATRLVAEELGLDNPKGTKAVMVRCLWYAAIFGTTSGVVLFLGASRFAGVWVGDDRCTITLKVLAVGLPFLSMGSALGGYFTAVQRVIKSASVQAVEQLIRMAVTVGLFIAFSPKGLGWACAAVAMGSAVGEITALGLLWVLYLFDRRRYRHGGRAPKRVTARLMRTALPVAFSAYARTALSTLQHLLIPRGLRKSGASAQDAFANYGIIHGMVFPILFFPSALLTTLAELMVPELTRSQVAGKRARVDYMVNRVFSLGLLFSVGVAGLLWGFAEPLGMLIYKSTEAARYLRIFAPLVPVMYMDMLTDGMLKGLGEQMSSMRYNIIDSLCSVILVYLLLPRYAVGGYVFMVWFTEMLNFALSVCKLLKITNLTVSIWGHVLRPGLCIAAAMVFLPPFANLFGLPLAQSGITLTMRMAWGAGLYFILLVLTGALTREDLHWLYTLVSSAKEKPLHTRCN
ncbi:MAG: oligosaccharide flippase family protein [Angelakisella sp.]|nr:oligosaccharide flippase family protein [Angelakisella sp.]